MKDYDETVTRLLIFFLSPIKEPLHFIPENRILIILTPSRLRAAKRSVRVLATPTSWALLGPYLE
jgi:hypothetical protein